MQPIPLIRKVALAPAIFYLNAQGLPVDRYLRAAKLSPPKPDTLESLIPLRQMCVFLNSVADAEGIDAFGFHIAGNLGIECLGSYWRLVAEAFTYHESIQLSREFSGTYNSGVQIWLASVGGPVSKTIGLKVSYIGIESLVDVGTDSHSAVTSISALW